jgi:hypothetical protein
VDLTDLPHIHPPPGPGQANQHKETAMRTEWT